MDEWYNCMNMASNHLTITAVESSAKPRQLTNGAGDFAYAECQMSFRKF